MAHFERPPETHTLEGRQRRVGMELEMAEVDLDAIAGSVVALFGGEHRRESPFVHRVAGTRFGDFDVELDSSLLKKREYLDYLRDLGIEVNREGDPHALEAALSRVAGLIVPHELVAPPVGLDALEEMDRLRARLREAGAKGTHASLLYAFGLQINVELPRLDADYILAVLRAFMLLYDWLVARGQADLTRRLTPFVDGFPGRYVRRILQPDYAPGLAGLIDDYLRDNPTRNRPLDMLPLFAHLDRDRVMTAPVERHLVKPRPTFHYRLPDCRIDQADWDLSVPWNEWVTVERLAADRGRLAAMGREYLETPSQALAQIGERWVERVSEWLRT